MKNTYIAPELAVCYVLEEDILTLSSGEECVGVEIDCSNWGYID